MNDSEDLFNSLYEEESEMAPGGGKKNTSFIEQPLLIADSGSCHTENYDFSSTIGDSDLADYSGSLNAQVPYCTTKELAISNLQILQLHINRLIRQVVMF